MLGVELVEDKVSTEKQNSSVDVNFNFLYKRLENKDSTKTRKNGGHI